jgi:hypothetical protein
MGGGTLSVPRPRNPRELHRSNILQLFTMREIPDPGPGVAFAIASVGLPVCSEITHFSSHHPRRYVCLQIYEEREAVQGSKP